MRDTIYLTILAIAAVFIFFYGLGGLALTDPDETFYAQTAKEMLNEGEWVTPHIFGKVQFEKPPFYYWLIMAGYSVFGINEFAARFPSAVFALLGIIGVYFLARLFFSSLSGILSGLILATCVEYIVLARGCVTDMVLAVFILYSLLFFLLGWQNKKNLYFLISSAMTALAVLTKGPIGLFMPAAIIFIYILIARQWREFRGIPIVRCVLVFLVISLPWYIMALKLHGKIFIDEFFGFHNVVRFLQPEHAALSSPFFYIPVIIIGFAPWMFFLPLGIWDMYKNAKIPASTKLQDNFVGRGLAVAQKGKSGKNQNSKLDEVSEARDLKKELFLLIWFMVVFVFFSVSRTKLVTYVFPLFPVLAIVVGRFWERFIVSQTGEENNKKLYGYMRISYFVFAICGLLIFAAVYIVIKYIKARYAAILPAIELAGAIFFAGVLLSLILFLYRKKVLAFGAIVFTVIALLIPVWNYMLPILEVFESSKGLAGRAKELAGESELIGGESDHRGGIAFYSDRIDIADLHPAHKLSDFIKRKDTVWCIVQRKHYEEVKSSDDYVPGSMSEPLYAAGKYVLITNKTVKGK